MEIGELLKMRWLFKFLFNMKEKENFVISNFLLFIRCIFLKLTHQKTYALNKICSEASIKLLLISALGCHHQRVLY
jgi:hypothetical protein